MAEKTEQQNGTEANEPRAIQWEESGLLYDECQEKLSEAESDLLCLLERHEPFSAEQLHRLYRIFHGIQGTATYLHRQSMRELSLAAEDLIGAARNGRFSFDDEVAERLLTAISCLKEMADHQGDDTGLSPQLEVDSLHALLSRRTSSLPAIPAGGGFTLQLAGAGPGRGRLKVLVVEDDFTSRVMLQGLLQRYGETHIAINGREAVEAFRAARLAGQNYDLVCMDIRMPEVDGNEAVRQIRAMEEQDKVYSAQGVHIFMTTGVRDMKTVTRSFKALCDAYLFKPIDGAQLEQNLRAFGMIV